MTCVPAYRSAVVDAVLAIRKPLAEEWDAWTAASPENARLRKIATAIFKRKHGDLCDCEEPVMGIPGADHIPRLGNGTAAFRLPIMPAWASYLTEAREALEATQ